MWDKMWIDEASNGKFVMGVDPAAPDGDHTVCFCWTVPEIHRKPDVIDVKAEPVEDEVNIPLLRSGEA